MAGTAGSGYTNEHKQSPILHHILSTRTQGADQPLWSQEVMGIWDYHKHDPSAEAIRQLAKIKYREELPVGERWQRGGQQTGQALHSQPGEHTQLHKQKRLNQPGEIRTNRMEQHGQPMPLDAPQTRLICQGCPPEARGSQRCTGSMENTSSIQ